MESIWPVAVLTKRLGFGQWLTGKSLRSCGAIIGSLILFSFLKMTNFLSPVDLINILSFGIVRLGKNIFKLVQYLHII